MKLHRGFSRIISFVSLLALCLSQAAPLAQDRTGRSTRTSTRRGNPGRAMTRADAKKLSDDLKDKLKDTTSDRVKVVLQFQNTLSPTTQTLLAQAGIVIKDKDKFEKLSARTVELPKATVNNLVAQNEVNFLSLDREVHSMGHLSATTGADLARGLVNGVASTGLDGSGIGIAVLDSGIDIEHKAFVDRNGRRRFTYGIDFTDDELEKPEKDPYGHGTHVASIAAGNGLDCFQCVSRHRAERKYHQPARAGRTGARHGDECAARIGMGAEQSHRP
ncbi:MAG: S8 family serine peptidase [Blastocatellia bacterium]